MLIATFKTKATTVELRFNKATTILLHCLFWVGYIGLAVYFFYGVLELQKVFLRILIHVGFLILLVYFNFLYLLPIFFDKRYYKTYLILLSIALVAITFLRVYADAQMAFSGKLVHLPAFSFTYIGGIMLSNLVMLSITSSFKFIGDWFENQRIQQELRSYQLEAELKFLKTQVNPHFLFNALNNIYALTYSGSKEAAPMILKLSEMMRYMIYEARDNKQVSLEQEINYLQNYIELYQLKSEQPLDVKLEVQGDTSGVMIDPLLFIPLLENSFKHGNLDEGGWVRAIMLVNDEKIKFEISNSLPKSGSKKDKEGGIGLQNIQKRLELAYPKKHVFEVNKEEEKFGVELEIQYK